jgi:hypothetical protein
VDEPLLFGKMTKNEYDCQDQIIRELIEIYGNGISPQHTLPDYAPKSGGIFWLCLSGVFLLVEAFFIFFSHPGKRKGIQSVLSICQNQQIRFSSYSLSAFCSLLEQLPDFICALLLYFLWFRGRNIFGWLRTLNPYGRKASIIILANPIILITIHSSNRYY